MANGRFRRQRDPDGRMSLGDHLRELRRRVLIAGAAVFLGAIAGWFVYNPLLNRLSQPVEELNLQRGANFAKLNFGNLTDPFAVHTTVALFVGLVLASPVWLFQVWAFIVPGLTRREKRTSLVFIGTAVPLFLAGGWLAYITLPKAVDALLSFTPDGSSNILPAADYLNFVLKFILAFGLAFLLPVFLVGLNAAGVLPARIMVKSWRPAVFLIFLFAAVMTPSPDPWSMIVLAIPMVGLYFLAVGISFLLDRRKARRAPKTTWQDLPDDQASPL